MQVRYVGLMQCHRLEPVAIPQRANTSDRTPGRDGANITKVPLGYDPKAILQSIPSLPTLKINESWADRYWLERLDALVLGIHPPHCSTS